MGMFDDLIPRAAHAAPAASAGMFDDLIPKKDPNTPGVAHGFARAVESGVPIAGGFAPQINAAVNTGLSYIPGLKDFEGLEGSAGERYSKDLERQHKMDEGFQKEHPYLQTAGELAGGLASMGGLGATALGAKLLGLTGGLGQMAIRGGLSGAGISAADALVRGGDPVTSGATGGLVGAAAPPVGRMLHAAIAPKIDALRGILQPEATSLGKVGRATNQGRILSDADIAAAQARGQPILPVDVSLGTRNLGRSATNTSSEAQQEIEQTMKDRLGGAHGRIEDWARQRFGDLDPIAIQEARDNSYRAVSGPGYKDAYEKGNFPIWNTELERLLGAPDVEAALRKAIGRWKNNAVNDGYGAMNPPIGLSDVDTLVKTGGKGMSALPNLQLWDYTARELANDARKVPGTDDARLWNSFSRSIKSVVDEIVPEFKAVRENAAAKLKGDDAFELGRKYATSTGKDTPEVRAAVNRMTPESRELFQKGFISDYVEKIKRGTNPAVLARKVDQSPAAMEQLALGFGDMQHARDFQAFMHVERIMDETHRAIVGNSTTARQLIQAGLAGGAGDFIGGGGQFSTDPEALAHAAIFMGIKHGSKLAGTAINKNLANQVARLLATGNTQQINTAMRMISQNRPLFAAVSHADAAIASLAARSGQMAIQHSSSAQNNNRQPYVGSPNS